VTERAGRLQEGDGASGDPRSICAERLTESVEAR
jgi:hypothetical protein